MLDPLIASRAVHFASSLVVAGIAIFSTFVAQSVRLTSLAARRQQKLMLGALALAVFSGATWLLFLASRIAQTSVAEAIGDGTAWSVLTETQFGRVWEARFAVAILLCCAWLVLPVRQTRISYLSLAQAALATAFVGMLAWSGHAAGTLGFGGLLHFGGDVFHLSSLGRWPATTAHVPQPAHPGVRTHPRQLLSSAQTVFRACRLERRFARRERRTQHLVHDEWTAEFSRHRIR